MITTAERLKQALDIRNMKAIDLHNATKINKSSISQYMNGTVNPKQDRIYLMAQALNVNELWLMGHDVPMERTPVPPPSAQPENSPTPSAGQQEEVSAKGYYNIGYRIPILGRVAAGIPIFADENTIGHICINDDYKDDGYEYFALKVAGHSMEPTIMDGDTIVVRRQDTVESGQIAIVLIDGDEATAKEVKESPEGITLIGHNVAAYQPRFYSNKEIEELPVKVIGRVMQSIRNY